jgi:SRP-independent targeting protein 2/TMEM208
MANAAAKKQAASNLHSLKILHVSSAIVNILFLFSHFILSRPNSIRPYLILSCPAFFLQYQLEKIGRPKFDIKGSIVSAGSDLSQAGLTEWFHDVIYVTWACVAVSIIFGNMAWYLYSVIPGYCAYKLYGMVAGFRSGADQTGVAGGDEGKSKRQEKLEKRGGQRMRYR